MVEVGEGIEATEDAMLATNFLEFDITNRYSLSYGIHRIGERVTEEIWINDHRNEDSIALWTKKYMRNDDDRWEA